MKKLSFLFLLICKRSLKKPSFLLILLIFPLAGFLFASISQKEEARLFVALYGEKEDDFSSSIIHQLCQSDYHLLSFYSCNSIEQLKKDVLTGRAQWGYIFPKDFETRLQTGMARKSISVLSSPSSLFIPVSNELIFSRVMEAHSLFLLKQSLENNDPSSSSLFSMAEDFYEHHLNAESSFSFQYSYKDATSIDSLKPPSIVMASFAGFASVLVFLSALTGILSYEKDKEQRIFSSVPYTLSPFLPVISILAPSILGGTSALLGLYTARQGEGLLLDTAKMALYILLLLVYCLLLKFLFRNFTRLSIIIPFLLLGSLIFSPIFIDFGSFSPVFRILSFLFPPTFYLL